MASSVVNDLIGLLEACGIEDPTDMGDEIGGPCPGQRVINRQTGRLWHEYERRPRHWSINKATGTFFCFSCHYSGRLVQLVMDTTKTSMWEATRLIHKYGMSIEALTTFEKSDDEPARPKRLPAASFSLFSDPPLRALRRRRITPEAAEALDIRWDNERGAWILPIKTAGGTLIGYQIKSPDSVLNFPPRVPKSQTLFGLNLFQGPQAILVESPLDVGYLRALGYGALASYGSAVSKDQLDLTLEYSQSLILALDNDKSGVRETQRILRDKWHMRIPTTILNYEGNSAKDLGDMDPAGVKVAIETAVPAALWSAPDV